MEAGQYSFPLPPLAYGMGALEPVISQKTMTLHRELFQGYANNLANAEAAQAKVAPADQAAIRSIGNDLAFNGSSYLLHSLYFSLMTPDKDISAAGPLKETREFLIKKFGSLERFKTYFSSAATGIQGPGWAVLAYQSAWDDIEVVTTRAHQNNVLWGATPILVLDVWEHAYYPDYGTNRAEYVNKWWSLVDWQEVNMRLSMAERGKILL